MRWKEIREISKQIASMSTEIIAGNTPNLENNMSITQEAFKTLSRHDKKTFHDTSKTWKNSEINCIKTVRERCQLTKANS